jgi:hypothetical protein
VFRHSRRTTTERPADLVPHARLSVAPGVATTVHDDETILLNVSRGRYHTLNGTASSIWTHLLRGTTLTSLIQCIGTEYGIGQSGTDQLRADIGRLLATLRAEGLIVTSETRSDA